MTTAVATRRSPARLRLTPSNGLIGLDIGSRFTKLAQVRRHRGRWVISALHTLAPQDEQPLAEQSLVHGALSQSLTGLNLRQAGFRGQRCAALLTGAIAEPRTLHLPVATADETEQMIQLELEDATHNLATGNKLEFDFWTSQDDNNSDRAARVSVLATPRHVSAAVALDLSQQSLNCETLDGLPFALARAVRFVDPSSPGRTYATLDWGCHEPLFVAVRNGEPVFHRVLRNCGLETAITAIRNEFTVSRFDASRLLAAVGINRTNAETSTSTTTLPIRQAVQRCLHPVLERLLDQTRRSLDFLDQHDRHLLPQSLWLFGGGAALSGVEGAFASQLALPSRVWEPTPVQISRDLPSHGSLAPFGAAVGLSLLIEEL